MKSIRFVIMLLMALLCMLSVATGEDVRKSLKKQRFQDEQIEVLRVKSRKIDSPAKDIIKTTQERLDECYKLLKKNTDIRYKLICINEYIQEIRARDSSWPIAYYELEASKLEQWNEKINPRTGITDTMSVVGGQGQPQTVQENSQIESIKEKEGEDIVSFSVPRPVQTDDEETEQAEMTTTGQQVAIQQPGKPKMPPPVPYDWNRNTTNQQPVELTLVDKIVLFLIIVCAIAIYIVIYRFRRRCSSCGRWGAMVTYNRTYDYREKTTYDQSAHKWKYKYYYTHHRRCKYCGNCDAVVRSRTSL